MEATRHNKGKVPLSLLPLDCLTEVAKVLEKGAVKYGRDNWRLGQSRDQITDSLLRHLAAIQRGEERDLETGELHSAHVACNALFLVAEDMKGESEDFNRASKETVPDISRVVNDATGRGIDAVTVPVGSLVMLRNGTILRQFNRDSQYYFDGKVNTGGYVINRVLFFANRDYDIISYEAPTSPGTVSREDRGLEILLKDTGSYVVLRNGFGGRIVEVCLNFVIVEEYYTKYIKSIPRQADARNPDFDVMEMNYKQPVTEI